MWKEQSVFDTSTLFYRNGQQFEKRWDDCDSEVFRDRHKKAETVDFIEITIKSCWRKGGSSKRGNRRMATGQQESSSAWIQNQDAQPQSEISHSSSLPSTSESLPDSWCMRWARGCHCEAKIRAKEGWRDGGGKEQKAGGGIDSEVSVY